ncbi:MAG TPA: hypothetical protein VNL39_03580 [Xanthobacteraceae bacterium]|nr:hypothetical protein [Xanthobacteraceae bacterium]
MNVLSTSMSTPAGGSDSVRRESVASDLSRLSVGEDGRLYWDDKPVVIRRRILLSGWQTFAAIIVSVAALIIAASGAVHVAISAHEWMCGAKWIATYCPVPASPPGPGSSPRPELPN